MKLKILLMLLLVGFVGYCGYLVVDSGVFNTSDNSGNQGLVALAGTVEEETRATDTEAINEKTAVVTNIEPNPIRLSAVNGPAKTVVLGQLYDTFERDQDESKYKFEVTLSSRGASVETIYLSEFDDRNPKDPQSMLLAGPMGKNKDVLNLANTALRVAPYGANSFGSKALFLNRLNWQLAQGHTANEATFVATLGDVMDKALANEKLRITKTYRITPGRYDLTCEVTVENLMDEPVNSMLEFQGTGGMVRESLRMEGRKVVAAYYEDPAIISKAKTLDDIRKAYEKKDTKKLTLTSDKEEARFAWIATTNKYFALILRPVGIDGQLGDWLEPGQAQFFKAEDKDEQECSYSLKTTTMQLAGVGSVQNKQTHTFEIYLGPKDKSLFEHNDMYKKWAYFQTIDFKSCCCPSAFIAPLAFTVMWLIKTLYAIMGPLGNYGIVIMFLVFLVRLVMHPITKKSQMSMMKMQKLAPKMQELQKKYANNKAEMNRAVMQLYRDAGVSPISGMLPMLLQMPVWIALWTAVYTSIDLRGAGFLPFWITDLSAPDSLFTLPVDLPFVGNTFNLLPILMGVVMFAQQKLMPTAQSSHTTNPEMAQQQKMMMVLMPLMFPIMLYNGPAGVNLYIMSSITAGMIEQMVIRKHIKEKEELEKAGLTSVPVTSKTGGKIKKKKPKPFFKENK